MSANCKGLCAAHPAGWDCVLACQVFVQVRSVRWRCAGCSARVSLPAGHACPVSIGHLPGCPQGHVSAEYIQQHRG